MLVQDAAAREVREIRDGPPDHPEIPALLTRAISRRNSVRNYDFVVPAKTPASAVQKLYGEFKAIGDEPDFRKQRLLEQGLVPVFNSPEQFQSDLTAERALAKRLFEESGMEKALGGRRLAERRPRLTHRIKQNDDRLVSCRYWH